MVRGAIGVRINDGNTDRTVTQDVRGLKFAKQADGGMRDAACSLTLPLGTFSDLGPSDRIYYTDTRTGMTLWDGYLEAPTPTRGPGGQGFEISALGGMARAADETRPLVYVDTDLTSWVQYQGGTAAVSANTSVSANPAGSADIGGQAQGLLCQLNPGSPVGTNQSAQIGYNTLGTLGLPVGSITLRWRSGKDSNLYRAELAYPGGFVPLGGDITTVPAGPIVRVAGGQFPEDVQLLALRIRRSGGAGNVADDTTWTFFDRISVVARRLTRFGLTAAVDNFPSVRADQVVEDLLGRLMTFCDPAASSVTATAAAIDKLTYIDGTTAQAVLDDLGDYEPDMLWEILQSTSSGPMGKHVFNYRPWPTTPRYEIGGQDGYSESGADVDLANRIAVTWTDIDGTAKVTVVTADADQYPALRALEVAGRVRDAEPVTLPDGQGSEVNALALGAAILADKNTLGTSARATIRRPITDLYTGRRVMPWEIEPGHLARVRETGQDLRLTEMEYDDDECATAITLGYPSRTRDQRIAALAKVA